MELWQENLKGVHAVVHAWLETQGKWVFLAPLFSTAAILQQMAAEGTAFQEVDAMWRTLTAEVAPHLCHSKDPFQIPVEL